MPNTFRDKNGANLSGHADKWSDKNRRATSHDAGQGSRGSRHMGTGIQGKLNTMPSDSIDTTKMSPDEKLKYFNSLGLLGSGAVKEEEEPQSRFGHVQDPERLRDGVNELMSEYGDYEPRIAKVILNAKDPERALEIIEDQLLKFQSTNSEDPNFNNSGNPIGDRLSHLIDKIIAKGI